MKKEDAIKTFGSHWLVSIEASKWDSKRKFIRGGDPAEWKVHLVEELGPVVPIYPVVESDSYIVDDVCAGSYEEALSFACQKIIERLDCFINTIDALAVSTYGKESWNLIDYMNESPDLLFLVKKNLRSLLSTRHKTIFEECSYLNNKIQQIKLLHQKGHLANKLPDIVKEFTVIPIQDYIALPEAFHRTKGKDTKYHLVLDPLYSNDIDKLAVHACKISKIEIRNDSNWFFTKQRPYEFDVRFHLEDEDTGEIHEVSSEFLQKIMDNPSKGHILHKLGWILYASREAAIKHAKDKKATLLQKLKEVDI